jgi:hypothetical protein
MCLLRIGKHKYIYRERHIRNMSVKYGHQLYRLNMASRFILHLNKWREIKQTQTVYKHLYISAQGKKECGGCGLLFYAVFAVCL